MSNSTSAALDDAATMVDEPITLSCYGRLPARHYVRLALEQRGLVLLDGSSRLMISTSERSGSSVWTEVLPVGDLLSGEPTRPQPTLISEFVEHELDADDRIRQKLEQQLKLRPAKVSLAVLAERLADALEAPVWIDLKRLEDASLNLDDLQVAVQWNDVPARQALNWMLSRLDLCYVVHDAALIITTPEAAGNSGRIGLHSAVGVIYESTIPPRAIRGGRGNALGGMAMGMGGGMGGMAGGMGMGGMAMGSAMGGGGFFGGVPPSSTVGNVTDPTSGNGPPPAAPPPAAPPGIGLSTVGPQGPEPQASEPPAAAPIVVSVIPVREPAAVVSRPPDPPVAVSQLLDTPLVDTITSQVSPTTWDEVGGPGNIQVFDPTLDIVISNTEEVHAQIESLLNKLRSLPVQDNGVPQVRLARVMPDGRLRSTTLPSLVDLILATCIPTAWNQVGGPCSLGTDPPRAALVVSANQETQESVQRLLLMLRRSRARLLEAGVPPAATGSAMTEPLLLRMVRDAADGDRIDPLEGQQPDPRELELLAVRRELPTAWSQWRRTDAAGRQLTAPAVVRQGDRRELRYADYACRLGPEGTQIAYPSLLLVEHGNWNEAICDQADVELPWLPHRSNAELSRLYEITRVEGQHEAANKIAQRLRLRPHSIDSADGTWFEATFAAESGQPLVWESYVGGKLIRRLRCTPQTVAGRSSLRDVRLEDPAGNLLEHWVQSAAIPERGTLPAVDKDWQQFLHLSAEADQRQVDRVFSQAVAAIRRADWGVARASLVTAAAEPNGAHPLVLLLLAACDEHLLAEPASAKAKGRRAAPKPPEGVKLYEHRVETLKLAVSDNRVRLASQVTFDQFPLLAADDRLAILQVQPAAGRTADDWLELVLRRNRGLSARPGAAGSQPPAQGAAGGLANVCHRARTGTAAANRRCPRCRGSIRAGLGTRPAIGRPRNRPPGRRSGRQPTFGPRRHAVRTGDRRPRAIGGRTHQSAECLRSSQAGIAPLAAPLAGDRTAAGRVGRTAAVPGRLAGGVAKCLGWRRGGPARRNVETGFHALRLALSPGGPRIRFRSGGRIAPGSLRCPSVARGGALTGRAKFSIVRVDGPTPSTCWKNACAAEWD